MTDHTAASRKARERARRASEGLKRIEMWVPVEREAEVKAMVAAYLDGLTPRQ